MTTKITNERLNLFVLCGKAYVNGNPKSKLWFAVDKILKIALKLLKKVDQRKEEKRMEFASKKEKGIFDLNPNGGWQFTDESWKKLVEALQVIDEDLAELPTHIVTEYDEKALSFDLRANFEGIVIPAIDYDTFEIDKFVEAKEE